MAHCAPSTHLDRPDWLPVDAWPFTLHTFVHDGRPVHYVDEGDGPTIVLVHAGMWSFIWRDLIADLRRDHRCVTLDFPGAGLTPGGREDVDLEAFAGLVGEWLDHLSIDRATFVVHDLGGVVGITAAAARPERVEGIIAINSFAWPARQRALRGMLRVMGSRTAIGLLGTARLIPRLSRTSFGVGRRLDRDDRRAFYGPYRHNGAAGRNFHRAMRSAARSTDLYERAEAALDGALTGVPAMTIFGEKNDQFGFADTWREHFPEATSHVIAGGNHFPMCDAPHDVASFIRGWARGGSTDQPIETSAAPG